MRALTEPFVPIEKFALDYAEKNVSAVRLAIALGFSLFSLFGVLDIWMLPLTKAATWKIRYLVACPALLLSYLLTYTVVYKRHMQLMLTFVGLISGGSIMAMIALSRPEEPGFYYYYAGLFLVMFWSQSGIRLRFVNGTATSAIIAVFYVIVATAIQRMADGGIYGPTLPIFVNNCFFLVSSFLISALAGYTIEHHHKTDYSQRRQLAAAYRDLREVDRLKSEFFANVSHELRTPLTLIIGAARELAGSTGKAREAANLCLRNASQLLLLINELLDLSRLEAGRSQPSKRTVDLAALIRRAAANFQSEDQEKIVLSGCGHKVLAEIDAVQIRKVLYNLISNGLKFSDEQKGKVQISLAERNSNIIIEIKDNGIGMPANQLGLIFERFTQVKGGATRRHEGTGIGLALAKEFVEAHLGDISVASELELGSTFTVNLPRGVVSDIDTDDMGADDSEMLDFLERVVLSKDNTDAQGKKREDRYDASTILIVEDNDDLRSYIERLLAQEYNVLLARDGLEGLEIALSNDPDLILTDVMMPRMSGDELLSAIRSKPEIADVPIIFLTARTGESLAAEGLRAGASDYIQKPFDENELLARISNLIKLRDQQNELIELNRKLESTIEHQMAELVKTGELKRFLPRPVVEVVMSQASVGEVTFERKRITVLFADLVGFTDLTDRLEPEELTAIANDFMREMAACAIKHLGTIDKYIGDAVMVLFGTPKALDYRDQSSLAIAAAISMRNAVKLLSDKYLDQGLPRALDLRAGINSGYASVGVFGSEHLFSYTALGGTVNIASRLQTLAEPGSILCSEATVAPVRDEIELGSVGSHILKGISHPIMAYECISAPPKAI